MNPKNSLCSLCSFVANTPFPFFRGHLNGIAQRVASVASDAIRVPGDLNPGVEPRKKTKNRVKPRKNAKNTKENGSD